VPGSGEGDERRNRRLTLVVELVAAKRALLGRERAPRRHQRSVCRVERPLPEPGQGIEIERTCDDERDCSFHVPTMRRRRRRGFGSCANAGREKLRMAPALRRRSVAIVTREDVSLARRGDRRARERIVREHLALVRAVASRYRDLGLPLDDLVQEGSVGLLEAIDSFDSTRSPEFEAYARFRVRRAIRNALTEQSRLVRLPKHVVERRRALRRAESMLAAASGHLPSVDELSSATGLSRATIVATESVAGTPVSLGQPLLEDGATLETMLVDAHATDPAAEAAEQERVTVLGDAVAGLPPREREVIERHFGLGCSPEDLAEVAADLHLSRQRTRTIERDALYRLRDRLERRLDRRS
jgi:RNA polymerase primary sigma factor